MSKIVSLEINGNQLDIRSKADTDLSNITDLAKKNISSLGLPGSNSVNLELKSSGSRYIMPDDGWLFIGADVNSTENGFVYVYNFTRAYANQNPVVNNINQNMIFPVNKNDEVGINYANCVLKIVKFIHNNGFTEN